MSFLTGHLKEGRGEYPAKSLNALQKKLLEYTFNAEILSENNTLHKNSFRLAVEVVFFSSGYNSLLEIFENTKYKPKISLRCARKYNFQVDKPRMRAKHPIVESTKNNINFSWKSVWLFTVVWF